jgi:beta-1,4-mannosyltransferase
MKAFFLPWTDKNPYQRNLAESLRHQGVEVTACRPGKFLPVLSLLWRHGLPDVLHMHWISGYVVSRFRSWTLLSSALLIAELATMRLLGVRIIWTIHNLVEHKKRNVGFELAMFRLITKICHTLMVHGELGRQAVTEAYRVSDPETRIVVVPHGNYLSNYSDQVDEKTARARLGLATESFVYLFLGIIRPYKGIEELLEAFRALDNPHARLLLVGKCRDANLAERITRAAAHDQRIVPILDFVADEEIQYYMRSANTVVLPFTDIFTSGSAILAMGFERALVVPRLGCLPEYVDSRGGILYAPGRTGLSEALQAISQADTQTMGRHNRALVEKFDWESIATETNTVYRRGAPVGIPSNRAEPLEVVS